MFKRLLFCLPLAVLAACQPNPCNRGDGNDTLEETYTNLTEFSDCQVNQLSPHR